MSNSDNLSELRLTEIKGECEVALELGDTDIGIDCVEDYLTVIKEVLELREEIKAFGEHVEDLKESRDFYKSNSFGNTNLGYSSAKSLGRNK